MDKGTLFWVIMILCLIGALINWPSGDGTGLRRWGPFGFSAIVWILLFLLGWQAFGFIVK